MIKLLRSKKGFTLVEIMIVVAIIGLLAAIAIPNFIKSRNRSRDAVCTNNMKQIASGLEQVCMENNMDATTAGAGLAWSVAPTSNGWGLVTAAGPPIIHGYLKTVPTCPINAANAYVANATAAGVFQIVCANAAGHSPSFLGSVATPFQLP